MARRAFTSTELLVSIGIIALLSAMGLPAIQRVRGAYDRVQCANRLRQLGIAAHHFNSDRGQLPPGYLGPSKDSETAFPPHANVGQWVGHFPMLFPYSKKAGQNPTISSISGLTMSLPFPGFGYRPRRSRTPIHTPLRLGRCRCSSVRRHCLSVRKQAKMRVGEELSLACMSSTTSISTA